METFDSLPDLFLCQVTSLHYLMSKEDSLMGYEKDCLGDSDMLPQTSFGSFYDTLVAYIFEIISKT